MKPFEVKLHDRLQTEFKFSYTLEPGKRKTEYEIETFFFMPYNLGIDSAHYRAEDFYGDIQNYLRFSAPTVTLEELQSGKSGIFSELEEAVAGLSGRGTGTQAFEQKVRYFGAIFKTVVKDELDGILKNKKKSDLSGSLELFEKRLRKLTERFRALRGRIPSKGKNKRAVLVYFLCDEYLGQMIEHYGVDFLERLKLQEKKQFKKCRKILFPLIKEEIQRRKKSPWQGEWQTAAAAGQTNEEVLYARSALKKFFSKVLFLRIHTKRAGFILEQILFGVASGLAMLFATVVAFWGQYVYGQLSFSFFLILVIGYVFKDRIKELIRTYLHAKLTERLFDHAIHIYNNSGEKIGRSEESFNFLGKALVPREILDRLPRDLFSLADADLFGEQAMVYRKRMVLWNKKILDSRSAYSSREVLDIFRLHVGRYLEKMDNPKKVLYWYGKKNYHRVLGSRIYKIPFVVRVKNQNVSRFGVYTLVAARSGIVRVDAVRK